MTPFSYDSYVKSIFSPLCTKILATTAMPTVVYYTNLAAAAGKFQAFIIFTKKMLLQQHVSKAHICIDY